MSLTEAIAVLIERRNWLTARIEAKLKVGWDTQWDTRERDAATIILDIFDPSKSPPSET